ncbi:F-box LRR-repeat 7 [Paramuricea clavata]|uniref:F-box LRR-repeat 7 n=1 Tax=Paramuricea clavata TaxID=317549 RepID=A0A7D9DGN2_PARCT|nr:F-box LRR-repeat 7 [Paramuricea clavata]
MAGFDEGEAEAIASNWVQNLRFRFARMGLNYHSESKEDEKSNDKLVDPGRKSVKDVEERVINYRKPLTSKGKVELSDLNGDLSCKNGDNLKPFEPDVSAENITSHRLDQCDLPSTRSERSRVNLESLREKRLHFFQQQKSLTTSPSFDNKEALKTLNVCDTLSKSVIPKESQNVSNENDEFENAVHYDKLKGSGRFDAYNKQTTSNEESSTKLSKSNSIENSKNMAWKSSKSNAIDSSKPDEVLPKSRNGCMSLTLDYLSLDDSLAANEHQRYLPINSSGTRRCTTSTRGFDNVINREISGGFGKETYESKDALQVFPIEIDDEDCDLRIRNTEPEVLLDYNSDSDSDFTLDDPISRHTSPRVEDSPIWERLCRNSGTISPLAQSVSPPAPQITGALYHEFSCSDKELGQEVLISVGNNESNKAHQRPRSLSHPSTARDCSEMCGSSYTCCCASPNDGVNVVCSVSSTKECVDVEISYSDSGDIMSNGWFNSSKHNLSRKDNSVNKSKSYSHGHLPNKQRVTKSQDDLMNNSVKNSESYGTLPNKEIDNINEQYFDVCICPACDEINRGSSNWCSECGAALASTKPISGKSIDLRNEPTHTGKPPIPKTQAGSQPTESSKINGLRQSPSTKKSVSIPTADSDFRSVRNKPKHNGRRWEKSNLAWSTFQDSHLSKPPSTKNLKNYPRKGGIVKEEADVSRPRSTSFKNPGNHGKTDDGSCVPGSLPRSHKFREFKKKKGNSSDHAVGSLTLKGIKATEKKTNRTTCKTNGSGSPKYDEITEMIRTSREKPQPYLCLPDEIILRIFCHLSHAELARCSCVCQQLQRISQDEILWRTITLRRNQNINDEFLEKIGSKKPVSLSLIKCRGNLVTSSGLRELFRRCADNLEELNFIGCNGGQLIGESILLHVALRCNKLRLVDASWSNVGDNGVDALVQNVERLECLCLNGCQAITDHSLKVVGDKHGESLRTFEIFGCFNVSAAAIKRLGQKCPNLETLNLGQCYKITSSDIGRLVSHLESIVNLDLRGCKQARDACVKTIVKHCPHLVNLVLANCPLITDVAMSEIATNLSAVRCLDVCGCVKVTDHGVRALARSCNRLNSLDLSSTSITQKSVMLLASYCSQNLQSLKLSFCVDVTDDSVSRLVKHCKRMKTLHLYGCKRLRNMKGLQKLNRSLKLEF